MEIMEARDRLIRVIDALGPFPVIDVWYVPADPEKCAAELALHRIKPEVRRLPLPATSFNVAVVLRKFTRESTA